MVIRFLTVVVACGAWVGTVLSSPYIGVQQCRTCHAQQYTQWLATPHATAHKRLTRSQQRDPRCGACHNTSTQAGHFGVQCESCHGPGRNYWPAAIMGNKRRAKAAGLWSPDESRVCLNCHSGISTRIQPFNFVHALTKVRHRVNRTTGGSR